MLGAASNKDFTKNGGNGKNDLILTHTGYVRFVASKLVQTLSLPQEVFDDLVAAGYLGLVEAAQKYNSKIGTNFKQYAHLRIRGSMIDSLRADNQLAGRAYRMCKALKAAVEYGLDNQRMGITPEESCEEILNKGFAGVMAYRLSVHDVEEEISLSQAVKTPEDILNSKISSVQIHQWIKEMPKKERKVFEAYYFKNKEFSQIAKSKIGSSPSWVSKLHRRAVDYLRNKVIEEELGVK